MSRTKNPADSIVSKPPELSVLTSWHQFGKDSSRKTHWEWFVIDQFLRGNHSIRASAQDNTLIVGKKGDAINYPINRIYSTFRSVRAFVTKHKPIIEAEPEDSDPDSIEYARTANEILRRDNVLNNYRKINKEWVYFGIKYGLGYRQIGYDPVKKCCIRWTIDPNTLLVGSKTGEMEDAPYIIKTLVRTVGYWKNKYKNPLDKVEIQPDNELADDEYVALGLQIKFQDRGLAPSPRIDEQTKLGYECWYRVFEKNKLGGTVNKVVFVKEGRLEFQETPFDDYPLIPYKADIIPNEAMGDGHLKHVIAPQRMLNLLNTQMLEYNHIVNRGRFLKDKNAGFRVINSKEGMIIEKNPGRMVQVLNPPAINPMLQWQIGWVDGAIEDLGGQHDASQGAAPQRVSSGDAIEALQVGDSNNISDLRDNFEDSLALEAAWILKMYSLFEKNGVTLTVQQTGGVNKKVRVMGQEAHARTGSNMPERYYSEDDGDYCGVCSVLPDHQVKVSVNSELGETKDAKLNLLFRLMDYGLPLKIVLENLEFPGVTDIFQRIAEETLAQIKVEAMKAQMAPQPGQVPGGPGGPPAPAMPGGAGGLAPEAGAPPGLDMMSQLEQANQEAGGLVGTPG